MGGCAAVAQYGQLFADPGFGLPASGERVCAGISMAEGVTPSHIGVASEGPAMATCMTVERTEA